MYHGRTGAVSFPEIPEDNCFKNVIFTLQVEIIELQLKELPQFLQGDERYEYERSV